MRALWSLLESFSRRDVHDDEKWRDLENVRNRFKALAAMLSLTREFGLAHSHSDDSF